MSDKGAVVNLNSWEDLQDSFKQTALWNNYTIKIENEKNKEARTAWMIEAVKAAIEKTKAVRDVFPNYTLHDGVHVLGVLNAMGGLLGDSIINLTAEECELLILCAAFHDLGMVYDDDQEKKAGNNKKQWEAFLKKYYPDQINTPYVDKRGEIEKNYLRELHPFRVAEILEEEEFRVIMDKKPVEILPKETIIKTCEAHGESQSEITGYTVHEKGPLRDRRINRHTTSPIFCAMMLRMCDLLDIRKERAPLVLINYARNNKKSMSEWGKNIQSCGFQYEEDYTDSRKLVFNATCEDPNEEQYIRRYLDYVEDELIFFNKLLSKNNECWEKKWVHLPDEVDRSGLISSGYVSEPFCLNMDQEKVLNLLVGEGLYQDKTVFVRELLQNAVDATLLRAELDRDFKLESDESRIDTWFWFNENGEAWFRIDDNGTGMTRSMIKNYFLNVGKSYYSSREIMRDLREHSRSEEFHSISKFGIGFLSCFLAGKSVEVSTLYYDDNKSKAEDEEGINSSYVKKYGIRLDIPGLQGYYTLRQQGDHSAESLKHHYNCKEEEDYRSIPGTSIVVKLDLSSCERYDFDNIIKYYICGTRMPIYYNGHRIGETYAELYNRIKLINRETRVHLSKKIVKNIEKNIRG